jgi:hypothetical protein
MVETYMSTKYELMAELRALNRGMKALPISKMKKHELEHSIDAMKKLKVEKAETPMGPPAKAGRPLSRPIVSESVVDEDVTLHVPKPLRERQVEKRSVPMFPGVAKRSEKKAFVAKALDDSDEEMSKKVRKHHNCNCEGCPKRVNVVEFN